MKNYIFILIFIFFCAAVYAQRDNSSETQIRNAVSSTQIIKDILKITDTSYSVDIFKRMPEYVDSICYSHKTIYDIMEEKPFGGFEDIISIGHGLERYSHIVGNFKVSYTVYTGSLLNINFTYRFGWVNKEDTSYIYYPTKILMDSLVAASGLPLEINYRWKKEDITGYSYSVIYRATENYFSKKNPDLILKIPVKKEDVEIFEDDVNYVNNPASGLTYGFACGIGGQAPGGLFTFAKIVHYKRIYLAEYMLYSPNPVTRLMAADAIEHYMIKENYKPPLKIIKKIKEVTSELVKINTCWGCGTENLTMQDAYLRSEENRENLYQNIIFFDN